MTATATRRTTADGVLRMPDRKGSELAYGTLVERRVSIGSSEVAMTVGCLLGNEAARTREARVFPGNLGYQCFADDPDRLRKPDGSVARRDRTAGIPHDRGYMPIPADLIVEVVPPNDTSYGVEVKVEDYLTNGFPLIWVIHADVRTVTVYKAGTLPSRPCGSSGVERPTSSSDRPGRPTSNTAKRSRMSLGSKSG